MGPRNSGGCFSFSAQAKLPWQGRLVTGILPEHNTLCSVTQGVQGCCDAGGVILLPRGIFGEWIIISILPAEIHLNTNSSCLLLVLQRSDRVSTMPDFQPVELMGIEEEEEGSAWEYQIHIAVRPWECPWSLGIPVLGALLLTLQDFYRIHQHHQTFSWIFLVGSCSFASPNTPSLSPFSW